MGITVVYDVTGSNLGKQPPGQLALYVTGSGGVPASTAQLQAHPDAVLIDQTPKDSPWESRADGDDFENGAVQLGELAGRAKERMASFNEVARVGQRRPFVYMSASDVTKVVNALIKGGVNSGVGLWVAHWSLDQKEGAAEVLAASGPFPIIAVQVDNNGPYDTSMFSTTWLNDRSHHLGPIPSSGAATPPGQWKNPFAWTWKTVSMVGTGMDGRQHSFTYDAVKNDWVKIG